MTFKAASSGQTVTSKVERALKGRCTLAAGPLQAYGIMGPTREQERAITNAKPSGGMADLEKEVAKCKGDQACMMRLAERAANMQAPDASGGTIQTWHPKSCSGSFKVEEQHNTNDRGGEGGEGGGGAYQEAKTISGTNVIKDGGEDGWRGAFIDHDVAKNVSTYHFTNIEPMQFETRATRTGYGAGERQSKTPLALITAEFPNPWAVLKGPPGPGRIAKPVDGGSLTVEWMIKR